jgi:hypothetical protein
MWLSATTWNSFPGISPVPSGKVKGFNFVVVAGAYRTGSTLQYNLIGTYVELLGGGRRIGLVDPDDVESVAAGWSEPAGFIGVAKSHHVVEGFRPFQRATAWGELVVSGAACAVGSLRNEGDVHASMCRKFGLRAGELRDSLLWREAVANSARWREIGIFEQQYDTLVEQPVAALRELCAYIGLTWDESAASISARECGEAAARRQMASIPPGEYDPVSLLHWDHLRDPVV